MSKNTLKNDSIREIKLNQSRFLLISIVIGLLIGLCVSVNKIPNIINGIIEKNNKENNLMDLKISTPLGFSDTEEKEIKNIKNINGIKMVKSLDAKVTIKKETYLVRVNSISKDVDENNKNYINRIKIISGRFPNKINEGLIEEKMAIDNNLSIGDLIELDTGIINYLRAKKIKIVGIINSSYYDISQKEMSNLENKENNYYVYIDNENFKTDYYNDIYITLKDKEKIDETKKTISEKLNPIIEERYNNTLSYLNSEIDINQKQLDNLYSLDLPQDSLNESIKYLSDNISNYKNEIESIKNYQINISDKSKFNKLLDANIEINRTIPIKKIINKLLVCLILTISITFMISIIKEKKNEIITLKSIGYNLISLSKKYINYSLKTFILSFIISFISNIFLNIIVLKIYNLKINIIGISYTLNCLLFCLILLFINIIVSIISVFIFYKKIKIFKNKKNIDINKVKIKSSFKLIIKNGLKSTKKIIMLSLLTFSFTTIILIAFNTKNLINKTIKKQFFNIEKYHLSLEINNNISENDLNKLKEIIIDNKNVKEILLINEINASTKNNNIKIIVPEKNNINSFISLDKKLNNKNMIISSNFKKYVNKKNELILYIYDKKIKLKKIDFSSKNYINNYIYMSPTFYKKITNNNVGYNKVLIIAKKNDSKSIKKLKNELKRNSKIINISTKDEQIKYYYNKINVIHIILNIYILFIIFTYLMYLSLFLLINIGENEKNMYNLRLIGYYNKEVSYYYSKENIILSLPGLLLGLILGSILTNIIKQNLSDNLISFSYSFNILIYLSTIVITITITYLSSIVSYYKVYSRNNM